MSSVLGRVVSASRALFPVAGRRTARQSVPRRHGGGEVLTWSYRKQPVETDPKILFLAEFIGGVAWYWVLTHFYYDFGRIVGEHPYPVPSEWTDEELGIPPDEDD